MTEHFDDPIPLEASLLGALLLKGELLDEQPPIIRDAGIFSPRGRRVYDAIVQTHAEHGCVAAGLVSAAMSNGHADEPYALFCLAVEHMVVPDQARAYAAALEKAVARTELIARAEALKSAVTEGDDQARMREHLEGLQDLVDHVDMQQDKVVPFDLQVVMDEPDEPVPYVIHGWLARRDFVVIGGEPGTGKSVFALDLAIALASGTEFLGAFKPDEQYRVLYLDEEMDKQLARRRIRQLVGGRQLEPGDVDLHYYNSSGMNLDRASDRLRLRGILEELQPQWVVLDSLIRFHSRNENDNSAMSEFFAMLKELRVEHECGMLALHHLAKPSKERSSELGHRLRGASDLRAACDQLWGIEGDTMTDVRQLKHDKNRWGRCSPTLTMAWEESDDATTAQLTGGATATDAAEMIEKLVFDSGVRGISRPDIIQVLRADYSAGSAAKIATAALGKLVGQGTLRKHRRGSRMHFWHKDNAPQMSMEDADGTQPE